MAISDEQLLRDGIDILVQYFFRKKFKPNFQCAVACCGILQLLVLGPGGSPNLWWPRAAVPFNANTLPSLCRSGARLWGWEGGARVGTRLKHRPSPTVLMLGSDVVLHTTET